MTYKQVGEIAIRCAEDPSVILQHAPVIAEVSEKSKKADIKAVFADKYRQYKNNKQNLGG